MNDKNVSGIYNIINEKDLSSKIDNSKLMNFLPESPANINQNHSLLDLGALAISNTNAMKENMHVPGNVTIGQDLKIHGHIQADEITIDVRKIILNMDYGYIEEVISKAQEHQLDHLLTHLDDLKLIIEKEKFKRT